MVEEIDSENWFYIIRRGTNEKWRNGNDEINVCESYHLPAILSRVNRFGDCWESISIADYNRKFRYVGV